MIIRGARYRGWLLGAWVLTGALGSCGKVAEEGELQLDSNTNWLERCESDDVCSGALRCYCGQCTQPCAQNDECALLEGAECAPSGAPVCEEAAGAGGLCVLGCRSDGECGLDFTCVDSQCIPRPCRAGSPTWDDVYDAVADDLRRLDAEDALFARYFSLANRWSAAPCDFSFTAEGQALSKLVNSLSGDAAITPPQIIDADQTLYRIDLRDYGWDLPVSIGDTEYPDAWSALVDNNAYALPFVGQAAEDAVERTGALVPVMFGNSLIATATRPEVYYSLARIPERLDALLESLAIPAADLDATSSFRAGFVDQQGVERLARQWQLQNRTGYLWQISDFGRPLGALFEDPLAEPRGESEIVFTLPNGLHAFAYMSADGERIAQSAAVAGLSQSERGAPRSNLRRHERLVNVRDQVREFVSDNPGNFAAGLGQVILQRYPGSALLTLRLEQDFENFASRALQAANVALYAPEPILRSLADFQSIALEDAAGDLLLTERELLENLGLLDPALRALATSSMARDDFSALYLESLCTLSVVLENQPDPDICP